MSAEINIVEIMVKRFPPEGKKPPPMPGCEGSKVGEGMLGNILMGEFVRMIGTAGVLTTGIITVGIVSFGSIFDCIGPINELN